MGIDFQITDHCYAPASKTFETLWVLRTLTKLDTSMFAIAYSTLLWPKLQNRVQVADFYLESDSDILVIIRKAATHATSKIRNLLVAEQLEQLVMFILPYPR